MLMILLVIIVLAICIVSFRAFLAISLVTAGFFLGEHLLAISNTPAEIDVNNLTRQISYGRYHYVRDDTGCKSLSDYRLSNSMMDVPPSMGIPNRAPDTPCRKASYLNKLWHLNVSDCGSACGARENALSCAYDVKESLKGDTTLLAALESTIEGLPRDISGEAHCSQRAKSIAFLGEIGTKKQIPFLETFIEMNDCKESKLTECSAALKILTRLKNAPKM